MSERHDEPRVTRGRHTTGRGPRGRHAPTRPASGPAHLATGRTPALPTVRQAHPALQTGEQQRVRPGDGTAEMPADPRPRRQELAPWSPHPPPSAAYADAVTPAGGTPVVEDADGEGPDDAPATEEGRRRRVRRRVGWVLIGGVGLYLVIIALGLAGVLFFGRLSPPGLDRLTRPTGSTIVETDPDADDPGAKSASSASPDTSDGADGDGPDGDDATGSTATGSSGSSGSTSGVDGTTGVTGDSGTIAGSAGGTDPSYPIGSTEPTSPPAPPSSGGSGTTSSPTTTTTEPPGPSSTTPPTTRPRGGPPDSPPGKP